MGQSASKKINIMYLTHATSLDNVIRILNSGYVYTELDAILAKKNLEGGFIERGFDLSKIKLEEFNVENQYPGVYMNVLSSNMVGMPIKNDISLYFCKSLLNRKDWHFDPAELNKMLKPLMYSRFRRIAEDGFSVVLDQDGEKRYIKEFFKGKRFFRKITKNKLEIKISIILMANSHPNIVKIYAIYPNKEDGSYMNIDMEFLDVNVGLDFNVYKSQLEKAKEFMHKLGIAYMDWKPDNIGFSAEGIPKVFDFDMSALYNPKTNIFTEIPDPKGYFWRKAIEAGMNTPIEVDNWIFNRMFEPSEETINEPSEET